MGTGQKRFSRKMLEKHLKEDHQKSIGSEYVKEIVYGGIDGIITTFAVVAGFAGASMMGGEIGVGLPVVAVLIFGLANLLADGFSMGVGEFLSARAEKKLYEKSYEKEYYEIKHNQDFEAAESIMIFEDKGFSKEHAEQLVDIYKTNPKYWTEFMMRYELEMSAPDPSPLKNAIATFSAFLFFGFLPLVSYIVGIPQAYTFICSVAFSVVALMILGVMRAKITQEKIMVSIVEIVGLGVLAGGIAYGVGSLFG